MYAHVNIWRMNAASASYDDAAAREIAARLGEQPGFRSYTLIRTGEREVAAVTVFDTEEQLHSALESVADFIKQRILPLAVDLPERRRGRVIFHATS
jgi:heme-degrading monooxygenase HmoA